jgi:hypothetical protein
MGLQPIQRNENLRAAGGADPLVRAGPPGPAASSIDKYQQQADVGVGCGPGGPPHFVFSTVRTRQTRVFAPRVAHAPLRAASPLMATHGSSKD